MDLEVGFCLSDAVMTMRREGGLSTNQKLGNRGAWQKKREFESLVLGSKCDSRAFVAFRLFERGS